MGAGTDHDFTASKVNPFEPGIVNRMLNSLGGILTEQVEVVAKDLSIVEGESLLLGGLGEGGGLLFASVSFLSKGSFSSLYCARTASGMHLLQVSLL